MTSSVMVGYKSNGLYIMKPYNSRPQNLSWNPISRLSLSNFNHQIVFLGNKTRAAQSNINNKRSSFIVSANGVPPPSGPPSSNPMGWIIGFMLTLVLPFFTNKLGPLGVLKNRIMNAVQSVEDIAETVEKVAEKVDEIAEDMGDDLPQGKLKDLVHLVEKMAEKTAKTADAIDDVIDKVQEVEDQVDDMIVETQAKKSQKPPKEGQDI